jgi:hypothetical protein
VGKTLEFEDVALWADECLEGTDEHALAAEVLALRRLRPSIMVLRQLLDGQFVTNVEEIQKTRVVLDRVLNALGPAFGQKDTVGAVKNRERR